MTRHGAVFGATPPATIRTILDRHVQDHLGVRIDQILFEAGAIGAVFGLRLTDDREIVLKAYQPTADLDRLAAVTEYQTMLRSSGFPCPAVLSKPQVTSGVPMVVEERLASTTTGNQHDARSITAMAVGLAWQIRLLLDVDGEVLNGARPAWANWQHGAWPVPHDPIFNFDHPAPDFEWLDSRANAHASVLRELCGGLTKVIGHTDWVWQNVAVHDGKLTAAFDWDSLAFLPEPAIVGLCAGAFTQGGPTPPDAPTWPEVADFLAAYEAARRRDFTSQEQAVAEHAAGWVRCYNARCQIDNLQRRDSPPPAGSFIDMITTDEQR